MNKQMILSGLLSVALLSLTACGNDDDKTTDDGQKDTAQTIRFKLNFADYNAEQELDVTRAANRQDTIEQQTVDLGNGLVALMTLQRDTEQSPKQAATRSLANDTYTMLAYDAATHAFKGDVTGTVSGGVFTATSANKHIKLAPGNYDFVCFNSKVTRSGNTLTVSRADAGEALIGRTTQTITATPLEQEVPFTMLHMGAKVRMKLTGYRAFSGVNGTLASVGGSVPGTVVYDAATGTQTTGSGAAMSANLTFGSSSDTYTGTHIGYSGQETFFVPGTNVAGLRFTFTSGTIYHRNMANSALTLHPNSPITLQQNGAYVLNVKLMYSFLYLMSDGSTGLINKTIFGGGTKTPVGVVVSQSNNLAIALRDANNGAQYAWSYGWSSTTQFNTTMSDDFSTNLSDMRGYEYTWASTYCTPACDWYAPRGSSEMSPGQPAFPAFYAAGHYTPRINGDPWHLPTVGEWSYVYTALGLGDSSVLSNWGTYTWDGDFANLAFDQVQGQRINKMYWTSSEATSWSAGTVSINDTQFNWDHTVGKGGGRLSVRPFFKY